MVDNGGIISKSSEATRGGLQAVIEVEGILRRPVRTDPQKGMTGWGLNADGTAKAASDQAKVTLDEAEIIQMEEGEPEPDLKDGRFTFWMNYAPKGKERPHVNTFFVQGYLKSGEALDAKRRGVDVKDGNIENLYDTRCRLHHVKAEDKVLLLFKQPKEKGSDEKVSVYGTGFLFAEDGVGGTKEDIVDRARKLCLGKNIAAVKRIVMMDNKLKQLPEWKEAVDNGTIAEKLGLKVNEQEILVEVAT